MELVFLGVVSFLAFIFTVWLAAHIAFGVYFSKLDKRNAPVSQLPETNTVTRTPPYLQKKDSRTRGSFKSPTGKVYEDRIIEDFAEQLNLPIKALMELKYKQIDEYNGWTRG